MSLNEKVRSNNQESASDEGEALSSYGNVQSHYRILVGRAEQRPQADLYAFNMQDSVPQFSLPLAANEAEPIIDLHGLLNQVYDRAGYAMVKQR